MIALELVPEYLEHTDIQCFQACWAKSTVRVTISGMSVEYSPVQVVKLN
jgi:hypothetical protein